jgi:glycosyltransferase involved in cell wall biosynthesis
MGRILVISYFFPPSAEVGANRFRHLSAQFLTQPGIAGVTVLTLGAAHHAKTWPDDRPPAGVDVIETGVWPELHQPPQGLLHRLVRQVWGRAYLGERFTAWLPAAVRAGTAALRRERHDTIIATGPPFVTHVAGAILAKRFGARLVLDYRDPWTAWDWPPVARMGGALAFLNRPLNRRLERWCVGRAARVVQCTELMRDAFVARLGSALTAPVAVLTNGIDGDELARNLAAPPPAAAGPRVFLYAGNLYWGRTLESLVAALEQLLADGRMERGEAVFHFYSTFSPETSALVAEHGLGDLIVEQPRVPLPELRQAYARATALVLISGAEAAYALPYKVFEYMTAGRPILAIAPPDSAVDALVKATDCGETADLESAESVAAAIERLLRGERRFYQQDYARHAWPNLAAEYLKFIGE